MILDSQNLFEPTGGTALTASAVSSYTIDRGAVGDLGVAGEGPATKIWVHASGAFAPTGATVNIQLQTSPDNATWTTAAETGALTAAQLNTTTNSSGGTTLVNWAVPRRAAGAALPRFYRLNYAVAGGPFTAGVIYGGFALNTDSVPAYPSGIPTPAL